MQLVLISLLFATYLPNSSLGIKCLGCKDPNNCVANETPTEIECGSKMCYLEEYMKNYTIRKIGCDSENNAFNKKVTCWTDHIVNPETYLRKCTCGTHLCNQYIIQCYSCYGNRQGPNEDKPFGPGDSTIVTDFECKKEEIPMKVNCPLDASLCIIRWNHPSAGINTIGCSKHARLPEYEELPYRCYTNEGVTSKCYCQTNLCNNDTLKIPQRSNSDENTEEGEIGEEGKERSLSSSNSSSKSSVHLDLIIITMIAVFHFPNTYSILVSIIITKFLMTAI